jgi:geranylgeranyl reductase family protein
VLIVGAGPAGSTAARTCAALGLRTILLEEHPEVGCPTHCTGKLSLHGFARFEIPASLIQTTLRAAALHAPDGTVARVRRAAADSHVVDRDPFDRFLARRAAEAGAEVITGARARAIERVGAGPAAGGRPGGRGLLRVTVQRRPAPLVISTPLVIDAEGATPVLPPQLGIALRRTLVHGLQYELEGVEVETDDAPDLYFGRDVAPGFFAWMMPIGSGRGRLGLAVDPRLTSRPPVRYLERVMAHPAVAPRVRRATVVRKLAGRIPILGLRRPTYTDGMMVIGDAAGQVKATSGGGIYFSMLAGEIAGRAAAGYLGGGAADARRALEGYEREWQAAFGREVRFTTIVRQTLNRLSDRHTTAVIRALATDEGLRRAVEEHGDTQYQSRLLGPALQAAIRAGMRDLRLAPTVLAALGAAVLSLWSDGVPRAQPSRT